MNKWFNLLRDMHVCALCDHFYFNTQFPEGTHQYRCSIAVGAIQHTDSKEKTEEYMSSKDFEKSCPPYVCPSLEQHKQKS